MIIATGSCPRRVPVIQPDGTAISFDVAINAFAFHNIADLEKLTKCVATASTSLSSSVPQPRSCIVVGGGYLGVKLASQLAMDGFRCTLICKYDRLIPNILSREVSKGFEDALVKLGVVIMKGSACREVRVTTNGRFSHIILNNKTTVIGDMCVLCIGTIPNVSLFKDGLMMKNGDKPSIRVNQHLETNVPGVYAIGDVCSFPLSMYDGNCGVPITQYAHAKQSGRCVVSCILERSIAIPYAVHPTTTFEFMGDLCMFWGDATGKDLIVIGDLKASFLCLWIWDGRILGALIRSGLRSEAVILEASTRLQTEVSTEWLRSKKPSISEAVQHIASSMSLTLKGSLRDPTI
jgi:NADPH-dependent 2,4-dienoyl-CoA reductase/sulfur reductase-like enzyme